LKKHIIYIAHPLSPLFWSVGFFILVLCGCTKEVSIELPGYQQQLVVDGRIDVDGYPLVLLTQSQNVYAPTDLLAFLGSYVADAQVSVSNGTTTVFLEAMSPMDLPLSSRERLAEMLRIEIAEVSFLPIKIYSTTDPIMLGQVGNSYTLEIAHQGKNYSGTTSLLPPVPLDNVYWKPDELLTDFGICWARLSDPANEQNAYKWEVKLITPSAGGEPKDNIFRSGSDPHFGDEYFDGLTFEFDTRYPQKDTTYPENYKKHYKLGDIVVIKLSRIDRYVYDFFDKRSAQQESSSSPFATPVNLPSNLSGGALGIWAGYAPYYDTLYCVP
jgi:hypothetical protein